MDTIFLGSKPATPVIGQPAEQVPQARHMSGVLRIGRNGAFSFMAEGLLVVNISMDGFSSMRTASLSYTDSYT
jgi:hypothetical protein